MKRYIKLASIGIGLRSLVFAIALLGLYSCEKDIYVTPPPYTPQLAVSAMVSNVDSAIFMYIGHNYGIFDNTQGYNDLLNDAKARIYKDGVLFDSITLASFSYNGQVSYRYYKKYTQALNDVYGSANIEIRVSHPDYPSCSATTKLPNAVPLQQTRFVSNAGVINDPFDGTEQTFDGVELTIDDPAGEENYYEVMIRQTYLGWDSTYYTQALNLPEGNAWNGSSYYFSDKDFNGSLHRQLILIRDSYIDPAYPLMVVWRNITKEKYVYMKSLVRFRNSNDNPFAEPANIYGNIQNGLGIFSLDRETVYPVQ